MPFGKAKHLREEDTCRRQAAPEEKIQALTSQLKAYVHCMSVDSELAALEFKLTQVLSLVMERRKALVNSELQETLAQDHVTVHVEVAEKCHNPVHSLNVRTHTQMSTEQEPLTPRRMNMEQYIKYQHHVGAQERRSQGIKEPMILTSP